MVFAEIPEKLLENISFCLSFWNLTLSIIVLNRFLDDILCDVNAIKYDVPLFIAYKADKQI